MSNICKRLTGTPLDSVIGGQAASLHISSTRLLQGGLVTINAINNTKFDIAAGMGIFINNYTDPLNSTQKVITWPAITSTSLTNLTTKPNTFIAIDANLTITQHTTDELIANYDFWRDRIILANVVHASNIQIDIINTETYSSPIDVSLALADLANEIGVISNGNNITGVSGQLQIQKASGTLFQMGGNWFTNKKNPNKVVLAAANPFYFIYTWRDGSGGWKTNAPSPTINPGRYDNNTTGSTTQPNGTVPNNSWTIQRGFLANNNIMGLHYGQTVYGSLAAALDGISTATFTPNPAATSRAVLIVYIILKGNCTDTTDSSKCVIVMESKFGGSSGSSAITTLQQAYENGSEPEVKVNTTRTAVTIQDADSTISASIFTLLKSNAAAAIAHFQSDGRIQLPSIHNNAGSHNTTGEIASGTYTPTLTHIGNVTSSSASGFKWLRVGQVITVTGSLSITPTAGVETVTTIAVSLPIPSDFTDVNDGSGVGIANLNLTQSPRPASFVADTVANRVEMSFYSLLATSVVYKVNFQYEVK